MQKNELKILTPIGMLGYSFSEDLFWAAVEDGVDAIILDSGSTDSGPAKLALGQTTVPRQAYERDLKILVAACHHYRVPVLIGSAGGDGTSAHVQLLLEIITDIIITNKYRPLQVLTIDADVPKTTVLDKLTAGRVYPCSTSVPALTVSDVADASVVVAQMGLEPWLAAMATHPDFDIIVAGRSYDPAPYAAFCRHRGVGLGIDDDIGLAYHMGKIMECGAACAVPKSAEALAIVRDGSFDIRPLDPASRCTPISVAAHTLYEKARPDLLPGPGGVLDLKASKFEQLADGRTCRVTGSRFIPSERGQYTVKLEGARVTGYAACFVGGIRDPIMVSQLDTLVPMIEDRLRIVLPYNFELFMEFFGKDPLVKEHVIQAAPPVPTEVGLLGKVLAATQEEAKAVASLAKVFFIHAPYPGQVATAGNLTMPFAPCDVALGPAAEFCLYHLMQVDDPAVLFPFQSRLIGGDNLTRADDDAARPLRPRTNGASNSKLRHLAPKAVCGSPGPRLTSPPLPAGTTYLANLASVIRTKNCGPYEITLDVMFPDEATYNLVKDSGAIDRQTIARLLDIERDEDLVTCMWWEPALAFKATMKRPVVSGGFRDRDVHGSGWHVPVMYLTVPIRQN